MEPGDPASGRGPDKALVPLFPLGTVRSSTMSPGILLPVVQQGTPDWAGSSMTPGGEVPVAQMTAELSLCLPARVKLDSLESSEP